MNDREYIIKSIRECITNNATRRECETVNIIDSLIEKFKFHYDKPVSSLTDLKLRENRKIKGDVFELFAKMYYETILWNDEDNLYSNVWLLNEVPSEILKDLGLKRNDMGIDLILKHACKTGGFSAVQVKYRNHNGYRTKNVIGWKQLSTFYALVNRSGPWKKHIVFTNADYIRHVGKRDSKDKTVAIGTLRNIKSEFWYRMSQTGIESNVANKTQTVGVTKNLTPEQIRDLRLNALKNYSSKSELESEPNSSSIFPS
jgi:hypothetical protein